MNKKGNLQLILAGVMIMLFAGFVLIFGLIILDELYQTTADDSGSANNETLSSVTASGEIVANSNACGFKNFAVVGIVNATGGETITSANYTIDARSGTVYSATSGLYNNTDWNISYTYNYGDNEACTASNETIFGTGMFADYFDLIALTIVITVVLSLIIVLFSMRRVR